MSDFHALLKSFRDAAKTEREKGNYFERIAVEFIKNDPGMAQEYEDAWLYSDWAKAQGIDGRDTGKLFQRVITVSLETMKIVRSLPPLDIQDETSASSRSDATVN